VFLLFGRKRPSNLLDMIPILRPGLALEPAGDENVSYVLVPRTNFLERLSVRFLGQPAFRRIRLDALGTFVLSHCDGQHRVKEIGDQLAERFGREAEPVLPRLAKFLEIVEMNGFIEWKRER
jgi:hypothetical protein